MKNISHFSGKIKFLLTDIDDTLTDDGRLGPEAYQALWLLQHRGIHVIPITGRPAGWCEMIARQWPVSGIVGENGGFYFRYNDKSMIRHFFFDQKTQDENRLRLKKIEKIILEQVPGCALASDQFCRLMDLAIDFCEDVTALSKSEVQKIVSLFEQNGAQAKVSSIHVNGWFGSYDKLTMTLKILEKEFNISGNEARDVCAFTGDSPNDEPMFQYFPHSFAVANIQKFSTDLKNKPTYVADKKGGPGFAQIVQQILKTN